LEIVLLAVYIYWLQRLRLRAFRFVRFEISTYANDLVFQPDLSAKRRFENARVIHIFTATFVLVVALFAFAEQKLWLHALAILLADFVVASLYVGWVMGREWVKYGELRETAVVTQGYRLERLV